MNALRLGLILSVIAFATAHAADDEMPVETIVVTAKRPAFIESGETMLVVTVTARARVVPDVITVSRDDSLVIEAPKTKFAIEPPVFELPKLSITPPRIQLALADPVPVQG